MLEIARRIEPTLRRTYRRLTTPSPPNLLGDRDVENSWIAANLPDGPGIALDIGAGSSSLSLIASMKGFNVVALDLLDVSPWYRHPGIERMRGDILEVEFPPASFDLIINCSTIEHVGLSGNYHVEKPRPDGDLAAMTVLRRLIAADGRMVMTIPVGKDGVFAPLHRVYGPAGLPSLLYGWSVMQNEYWVKDDRNHWVRADESTALTTEANRHYYGLGLFVLRGA